jgi:hypothetical protein
LAALSAALMMVPSIAQTRRPRQNTPPLATVDSVVAAGQQVEQESQV